jgi:hypothetical protein
MFLKFLIQSIVLQKNIILIEPNFILIELVKNIARGDKNKL